MAVKTDSQIDAQLNEIRDETAESGNTTTRIYDALKNIFDTLLDRTSASPAIPDAFKWVTAPNTEIADGIVYVSSSVFSVNGVQKNRNAVNFADLDLPGEGYMEPNIVVLNYNATSPVYEIVFGETYAENESYIFPPVPANRAWVSNFILRNTGPELAPGGVVKSLTINGAMVFPDAEGNVPLEVEGGGAVDTVNGQTPDGSKNVLIEAQHIDYTPADTGLFTGLLTGGKLKIKAALDAIVTKLNGLSNRAQWNFFELDTTGYGQMLSLRGSKTFTMPNNRNMGGFYFQVSLNGSTWTTAADLTALNTWVTTNVSGNSTTGTQFYVYPVCTSRTNPAIVASLILTW